jgi:arsenite-transporting ATPase
MFGGKGGVGKTTCAAAAALSLASTQPRCRVLLVSTDPAHSLADVMGAALSDAPRPVPDGPDNLRVRELDASRALESIRDQYAASIDALFDRLARGSSFEATHDRRVMQDLFDLAPPGLDELAAVLNLVELLDGDADHGARAFDTLRADPSDVEGRRAGGAVFDAIVMDTAPTGHALRLLQMPETVQNWTKALMNIQLKYQPVIGIGELGVALLRLSRGLGRLRTLLSNPEEAQFVVVTRGAALPRAETNRLLRSLRRLRVSVAAVIVNAAGSGTCSRCCSTERRERREIASLAAATHRTALMIAPAAVPPPVGVHALDAWRKLWRTVT